jgi:hypothetical protein
MRESKDTYSTTRQPNGRPKYHNPAFRTVKTSEFTEQSSRPRKRRKGPSKKGSSSKSSAKKKKGGEEEIQIMAILFWNIRGLA